jgi:hypothetical protein
LISTTTLAMISVAASITSKYPATLARLIVLPSPVVETNLPLKMKILGHDAGVPRSA